MNVLVVIGNSDYFDWRQRGLKMGAQQRTIQNAIMVIYPYRHNGMWVFDDEATGLVKEPFVAGIPEIIDAAVANIPNAETGFRLMFSASPFPGHQAVLNWIRKEFEGDWYQLDGTDQEGWLCPALLKYFGAAPKKIFVAAEKK